MDFIDKTVSTWLSLSDTTKGYLAQISTMLTLEATEIALTSMGSLTQNTSLSIPANRITQKAAEILNTAYKYVLQPNVGGVTIFAESEKQQRQADVSERMVLSVFNDDTDNTNNTNNTKMSKAYTIDNNVPHLRIWTISGHIVSSDVLSQKLIIKPDIMTKVMLLDSIMTSRLPVLYKTHDCRFYKVIISDYSYEYEPRSNNAVHVDITLKEFKTMSVTGKTVNKISIQGLKSEDQKI